MPRLLPFPRHRRRGLILAAVLTLFCAAAVTAAVSIRGHATPGDMAARLCKALRTDDDAAVYRAATPELRALWNNALDANAAFEKANPGDKPPLGDGIPLAAFPDHAPVCQPGTASTAMTAASVDIHHIIPAAPGAPAAEWVDRLVLRRTGGTWRIDDILFAPDWRSGLRTALEETRKL